MATDAHTARSTEDDWRRRNLVTVALLIARAALRREESRGGHFRQDFPARDDDRWRFHVVEARESLDVRVKQSTRRSTQSRAEHSQRPE